MPRMETNSNSSVLLVQAFSSDVLIELLRKSLDKLSSNSQPRYALLPEYCCASPYNKEIFVGLLTSLCEISSLYPSTMICTSLLNDSATCGVARRNTAVVFERGQYECIYNKIEDDGLAFYDPDQSLLNRQRFDRQFQDQSRPVVSVCMDLGLARARFQQHSNPNATRTWLIPAMAGTLDPSQSSQVPFANGMMCFSNGKRDGISPSCCIFYSAVLSAPQMHTLPNNEEQAVLFRPGAANFFQVVSSVRV